MAPDGRMYHSSRKGELFELKQGLNATTMKDRKNSLKRTVASMTLGKDVSSLFTDVVKNTAGDLSMKKLVYLYIINYAQAKPDLAILIVNTFIKDAVDPNPLVRALAIRTMALIPLDKITEYLCDPLHAALKDQDPYVRKTAAVCVAKLYDTNPTIAVDEGFIKELQELLTDGNPMVVSNAVAALSEIAEASNTSNLLTLTSSTVPRFLSAMSECTEWGQIFILDAISAYVPGDAEEADLMVERIIPRLQHANPAVVLSAIRIIVNLMPRLDSDDKRTFLVKKMSAPLVTLLTSHPELQFVALRNISLLITKYPALLSSDPRVFFVSYADPPYVKNEKLNILVRLTNFPNALTVLTELMEYAGEVDIVFAQKAISSIARIALRLPSMCEKCVTLLSELLKRKVAHVTEEVAVAMKDILRSYPDQFRGTVSQLCDAADQIDDPAAKASLVWVIGEHAGYIPTAVQMLEVITETIDEESIAVQLQILTACVKAYIIIGPDAQKVVDTAVNYATQESENVDVRDRGFMYLRLVSAGSDSAQQIVLSNKQGVDDKTDEISAELQAELLRALSTVAAVYHKPTKTFAATRRKTLVVQPIGDMVAEEDLLGLDPSGEEMNPATAIPALTNTAANSVRPVGDSLLDDILGSDSVGLPTAKPTSGLVPEDDLLSTLGMGNLAVSPSSDGPRSVSNDHRKELLSAERGNGLLIKGCVTRGEADSFLLDLEFFNASAAPMADFAIQFNKNTFGLVPSAPLSVSSPLAPSSSCRTQVPLQLGGSPDENKGFLLQIAVKFSPGGVVYFAEDVSDHIAAVFDRKAGMLSKPNYRSVWSSVPDTSEVKGSVSFASDTLSSVDVISKKLASGGIFTVGKRMSAKPPVLYLSAVLVGPGKMTILGELTLPANSASRVGSIASRSTISTDGNVSALVSFNETCSLLLRQ